jgi:translation initiation factor IF-2
MARRLVKVAKELNVGTSTIVEYLSGHGFEIDNKPTAKVDDVMYDKLLQEFSSSAAVKEKAERLKREEAKVVVETPPPPPPAPKPTPAPAPPPPPKEEPAPVAEQPTPEPEAPKVVEAKKEEEAPAPSKVVEAPKEVKEEKAATEDPASASSGPKLKVLGKIDLDQVKRSAKKKPSSKKPADKPAEAQETKGGQPKKAAKPEPVADTSASKPAAKADKEKPAAPSTSKEPETIRAKTPQLAGLKILGKIDKSKLVEKKPTKTKTDDKSGRRKRTRKKINTTNFGGGRGRGPAKKGGRRDEVKEVTQKEIDDKIKATMARLSGGGKKKRQKIRRDNRQDKREKQEQQDLENVELNLKVTEFISVSELASLMNASVSAVIMTCMNLGVIVSINQRLDAEIIELVANEFGHEVEFINAEEDEAEEEEIVDAPEDLEERAPIVTVMGHVDHGKTSLLDHIRQANVADGEAGGITQHIGAYEVLVGADKKKITFLDTPGHEAFTAMRARGAKVTDIAVIIVAADDRIMPQTKEAISHAQAAGVPMVFAINKIDKDGASPDRIKQELSGMNILVEEWGGTFQSQDISAKKGTNIDELLEKIIVEAEVLELQANPDRPAIGAVIEASLDKGRGYVTKILVQTGTLKIGDPIVAGSHSGKVKAMYNERGKRVKEAGPSTPVLVLGLSGAPQAGERMKVTESEQEARTLANKRSQIEREQTNRASKRISLDEIGRRLALGNFKELNLIVKGDVDGSVEALSDSLIKQSIESVQVNVIHKAVGQIIESDVLLASASDAIIIGFQVRPSGPARQLAEKEGVEIKTYSIIYEAIEEIKMAIEGMLEPTKEEKVIGQVEVRETFKISKVGTIAGAYVTDGKVTRNSFIRVIRNGIVVFPIKEGAKGEIDTLKRFKDDAKEVKAGFECGLTIKGFNDIKVEDVIEVYEIIEVKQTLKSIAKAKADA